MIALGGGVGSMLRYALERAMPSSSGDFPAATLLINLTGSFLLGVFLVIVTEVRHAHPLVRPALGTGLLGGFTTFSTFAMEMRDASAGIAIGYGIASLAGGILLALLGMRSIRSLERGRLSMPDADEIDPLDPDLP